MSLQPGTRLGEFEILGAIAWAADDASLFMANRDSRKGVDRVVVATGARTHRKTLVPSDAAGVTRVLGTRLLADGGVYGYSYERVLSQLLLVTGLR